MKSELLITLEIVERLLVKGPAGAAELCAEFDCAVATLKRRLDDARQLGAHVESLRSAGRWLYVVGNGEAVQERLARWIELERDRSLV